MNISMVILMAGLKMEGILKYSGLKLEGPLYSRSPECVLVYASPQGGLYHVYTVVHLF